jgi:hypothetical protein
MLISLLSALDGTTFYGYFPAAVTKRDGGTELGLNSLLSVCV